MADATIKSIYLVLKDGFPGIVNPSEGGVPVDGFAGASHHNVASPVFNPGTKRSVYIDSLKGESVLTYLQNGVAPSVAIAAGQVCVVDDVTNNASYLPTLVTADPDEGLLGGPVAIAISAMTDAYYGWFWTGGVCPVGHGSMTATTTTATDDSLTARPAITVVSVVGTDTVVAVVVNAVGPTPASTRAPKAPKAFCLSKSKPAIRYLL